MPATKNALPTKDPDWTPALIRMLQGKRSQATFGGLIGVPKNTVWRWETGSVSPDPKNANKLSALAHREGFLQDWHLAGSMVLIGEVESASKKIGETFKKSLVRSAKQLKD
ncbi:MAG TPA: helix-turn-helix transcriptional regulator [Blastocatellia bacterium]|nr:helix-turn-helix transcriptional regulator [Blastocatellia bacterium]